MSLLTRLSLLLPAFMVMTITSYAFNPPVDESEKFRVEIQSPTQVDVTKGVFKAVVNLTNKVNAAVKATCLSYGTDGWKATFPETGREDLPVDLNPMESRQVPLEVLPASDSLPALYPLHVKVKITEGTTEVTLHAIAILEPQGGSVAKMLQGSEQAAVVPHSPLQLMRCTSEKVEIFPDKSAAFPLPGGWSGMDSETNTTLVFDPLVTRSPKAAPAIAIHPPFRNGPGNVRLTWRVNLPRETPITLNTALAMRDTHAPEPPSDGVTFRVLVDGQPVFEKNTNAKAWEEVRVDLSPYAGKEIGLSIESDPGPRRDTTCDQSFWRQPWILAGEPMSEQQNDDSGKRERIAQARQALEKAFVQNPGIAGKEGVKIFFTSDDSSQSGLAVLAGPHGLLDGAWATGVPGKVVAWDGFDLLLDGISPLEPLSGCHIEKEEWQGTQCHIDLTREGQPHWVTLNIGAGEQGFELKWNSDLAITDLAAGRFDTGVGEVYAGVGNVIKAPFAPFILEADGHRLASRHVGLHFENDLDLVLACSNPPDRFVADTGQSMYSLHTHLPGSFYLIASDVSAFDAAIKYREMIELKAGPGVEQLKGRFSFDLWGGHYAATADAIENAAKYGLTHSVVIFHNWQRWGYDYRLPDIYPPNPDFGSLEDMKRLREVCKKHGILFAPHDNYIDIYPDADEFSYDLVCFNSSGTPWKAWYNEGRKAQAFRFRPDKFMPFLERNIQLQHDSYNPDAYFIDVFSSIGAFDYWDREGKIHYANETIDYWCKAFDRVREILGGDAPQISESGTDWLIGHLDGAQCNHIGIFEEGCSGFFTWNLQCAEHERIPWQDVVLHDVFVLEGAGYSSRYAGGRDLYSHGMHSDDYLCAEILTGHPPMTDTAFSRAAVRKYWLLHDFSNEIAGERISSAEFVDGDIHRQKVTYTHGAQVWVNRGKTAWTLPDGHILPPYGFWAQGPTTNAGIIEKSGRVVEEASGPQYLYADGRGVDCQTLEAVEVGPTDFGWCRTNAGLRLTREDKAVTVTPLPSSQPLKVELDLKALGLPTTARIRAERMDGSVGEVVSDTEDGYLVWEIDPGCFAYKVEE